MKIIDYIIKNLQSASFLKDIKNEYPEGELGWGEDVVLKNVLDYNDIEYQLTYLKYFYGDINKEIDKTKVFQIKQWNEGKNKTRQLKKAS